MERLPVSNTVIPGDALAIADGRNDAAIKDGIFNLLPPAFLALVVAFWAFAPDWLTGNGWTIIVSSSLVTVAVLGLESSTSATPAGG